MRKIKICQEKTKKQKALLDYFIPLNRKVKTMKNPVLIKKLRRVQLGKNQKIETTDLAVVEQDILDDVLHHYRMNNSDPKIKFSNHSIKKIDSIKNQKKNNDLSKIAESVKFIAGKGIPLNTIMSIVKECGGEPLEVKNLYIFKDGNSNSVNSENYMVISSYVGSKEEVKYAVTDNQDNNNYLEEETNYRKTTIKTFSSFDDFLKSYKLENSKIIDKLEKDIDKMTNEELDSMLQKIKERRNDKPSN